jgi:hypothetical protein
MDLQSLTTKNALRAGVSNDDVGLCGKYVYINLTVKNLDFTTYRDQVTFNTASRYRDKLSAFYGFQSEPIVTRSGKVVAPNRFVTTREISTYIPEGIAKGVETRNISTRKLPLVVHFPSGDYAHTDHVGKYRGALFTHPDALYWASEASQANNPAFVVTVGGPVDASGGWQCPDVEYDPGESECVCRALCSWQITSAPVLGSPMASANSGALGPQLAQLVGRQLRAPITREYTFLIDAASTDNSL